MQIAAAGDDGDFVFSIANQRQVERAAAQIVNQDPLLAGQLGEPEAFAAEHVTQGRGHRLVDDVDAFQSGGVAGLNRGMPLSVAELRGDRNHGLRDRPDLFLRRADQLFEDQRRNVAGAVGAIVDPPALADVPHEALGVFDHAIGKRIEFRSASVPTIGWSPSNSTTEGVASSPS